MWIYKVDEKEKGYPIGHWTNAGLLFFVAIGCLGLSMYYRVLNRRILREAGVSREGERGVRLYRY